MKRFQSFILSIVILLSSFGVISHAETIEPTAEELYVAVNLGIMDKTTLNRSKEAITRGEFVDALMKLVGGKLSADKVPFSDVSPQSQYYESICLAYTIGYVNGYSDGTFREKNEMLQNDAVRLLTYAIGYRELIEMGMPVEKAAKSSNICNYAEALSNKVLTVEEAAKLLMNTGDALVVSPQTISEVGSDYFFENQTVLEKYKGIHNVKGIVTANEFTYLNESNFLSEGWINVGDLSLQTGNSGASELLGYNASIYYYRDKDSARGLILSARPYKNRVVEVAAKDVDGYDNGELFYTKNKKTYGEKFSIAEVDVIYNNRLNPSPKKEDFDISVGKITIIDNNNDGEYDVVKILSYENFIVDSLNKAEGKAYGKWSAGTLDFEAESYERVSFISDTGSKMDVRELAEWDVLAVAESKDQKVMVAVYITGMVEGTITNYIIGEDTLITIDGVVYEAADCFLKNQLYMVKKGASGLFYLDIDGRIAAANLSETSQRNFGYLIKTAARSSSFDNEIDVKLMLETSEKLITTFSEKVIFNGKVLKIHSTDYANKLDGLSPQLVIYGLDSDGRVNYIDTACKDNDGTITDLGEKEDIQSSLCMYYDGFTEGATLQYRTTPKVFGGKIAASANTLIFQIPQDPNTAADDDYWVYSLSWYMKENDKKCIQAYKTNHDSLTAEVILLRKEDVDMNYIPSERAISVVNGVQRVANEEGEVVYLLEVYTGKNRQEYTVIDDTLVDGYTLNGEPYSIEVGDVIQITVDIKNRITNCKLIYSKSKDCMNGSNPSSTSFLATFRVQMANVYQKYKNNVLTTTTELTSGVKYLQSGLENLEMRNLDNYVILRFDAGKEQFIVSGQNDLIGHVNSGNNESSKVFIYDRDGDGRTMVIYD